MDLDQQHYKLLADFENCFADGAPSLIDCDSLKVTGKVKFAADVICRGKVEFVNKSAETKTVASGIYSNEVRQVA